MMGLDQDPLTKEVQHPSLVQFHGLKSWWKSWTLHQNRFFHPNWINIEVVFDAVSGQRVGLRRWGRWHRAGAADATWAKRGWWEDLEMVQFRNHQILKVEQPSKMNQVRILRFHWIFNGCSTFASRNLDVIFTWLISSWIRPLLCSELDLYFIPYCARTIGIDWASWRKQTPPSGWNFDQIQEPYKEPWAIHWFSTKLSIFAVCWWDTFCATENTLEVVQFAIISWEFHDWSGGTYVIVVLNGDVVRHFAESLSFTSVETKFPVKSCDWNWEVSGRKFFLDFLEYEFYSVCSDNWYSNSSWPWCHEAQTWCQEGWCGWGGSWSWGKCGDLVSAWWVPQSLVFHLWHEETIKELEGVIFVCQTACSAKGDMFARFLCDPMCLFYLHLKYVRKLSRS